MDTRMVKRNALKAEWIKTRAAVKKAKHDYDRYANHHGYAHRLTRAMFNTYMTAWDAHTEAFNMLMDRDNYMR